MTLVPQLIFDGDERLIYCDRDDITGLGQAEVEDCFYTRLRGVPTVIFGRVQTVWLRAWHVHAASGN